MTWFESREERTGRPISIGALYATLCLGGVVLGLAGGNDQPSRGRQRPAFARAGIRPEGERPT